jgi:hypothetical protein
LGTSGTAELSWTSPCHFPEGAKVQIEILDGVNQNETSGQTLGEKLLNYAGRITDAPSDLAEQHDHYLHGTAKK